MTLKLVRYLFDRSTAAVGGADLSFERHIIQIMLQFPKGPGVFGGIG